MSEELDARLKAAEDAAARAGNVARAALIVAAMALAIGALGLALPIRLP